MWLFLLASSVLIAIKTTYFQLGVLINFTVVPFFSTPISAPVSQSIDRRKHKKRKPGPPRVASPLTSSKNILTTFSLSRKTLLFTHQLFPNYYFSLSFFFFLEKIASSLSPRLPDQLRSWVYCKIKFTLNYFHGNLTHGFSGSKAIISLFWLETQACQKVIFP